MKVLVYCKTAAIIDHMHRYILPSYPHGLITKYSIRCECSVERMTFHSAILPRGSLISIPALKFNANAKPKRSMMVHVCVRRSNQ